MQRDRNGCTKNTLSVSERTVWLQNSSKSKIGAETYNTDLTNQNHCEEQYTFFQNWQKYILQN